MFDREQTKLGWASTRLMIRIVLAALFGVTLLGITGGPVEAASCEIEWDSDVTYVVDRASEQVLVKAELTVADHQRDDGCGSVRASFPIVPLASGLAVGASIDVEIDISESADSESSGSALLTFATENPDDLRSGVSVSYTMPADGDWVAFGPSKATFPTWSIGDVGAGQLSVRSAATDVVSLSTELMTQTSIGSVSVDDVDPNSNVFASVWFGDYERFELGNGIVYFRESGDPDPSESVIDGTAESLAVLEDLFGSRPMTGRDLGIIEISNDSLAGYAGRYSGDYETIEISGSLVQSTLIHELSHAWFSGSVFADPWLPEGLADFVATRIEPVMADTDGEHPQEVRRPDFVVPLVEWEVVELVDDASEAVVDYGYQASVYVMSSVADEFGEGEFLDYVADTMNDARVSGNAVDSAMFFAGLKARGFEDESGVAAKYVFGGAAVPEPSTVAGVDMQPPPIDEEALTVVVAAGREADGENIQLSVAALAVAAAAALAIGFLTQSMRTSSRHGALPRSAVVGDQWDDIGSSPRRRGPRRPDDDWLI